MIVTCEMNVSDGQKFSGLIKEGKYSRLQEQYMQRSDMILHLKPPNVVLKYAEQ